jgi:hypothetical protein
MFITTRRYLDALDTIQKYVNQMSANVELDVIIKDTCPSDFWYSTIKDKSFQVTPCQFGDLRDVEGFSNKEIYDCYKVIDGEFKGNIILKEHCF